MATINVEKRIRKFVREQFAARISKVDGEFQCVARNNSARVIITNPNHTLAAMRERLGKPIAEHGSTAIFKVGKVGRVALTKTGTQSVLTLVTNRPW